MITTRAFMDQTWVDLTSPTKEEVDSLILTQNISPIIANDLLTPTPTQYTEDSDKVIYIVLHLPTFSRSHPTADYQEIDFIISEGGVVTGRYSSIDALHYFAKQVEVGEILNKVEKSHLFFGIMKEIYKGMDDELSSMSDWMKEIERNIFEGQEKAMVPTISKAGRDLLNFKRIVEPHGSVLESLKEIGKEKFGAKFGAEIETLSAKWRHIMKRVGNQMDLIMELRETNNSLLSAKQNEIMKNLAVLGSVLLPMTIIGQIFGMSFRTFPLVDNPYAFWIVIVLMASVMILSLVFAKIKKWM
jgi:magnesium transporter